LHDGERYPYDRRDRHHENHYRERLGINMRERDWRRNQRRSDHSMEERRDGGGEEPHFGMIGIRRVYFANNEIQQERRDEEAVVIDLTNDDDHTSQTLEEDFTFPNFFFTHLSQMLSRGFFADDEDVRESVDLSGGYWAKRKKDNGEVTSVSSNLNLKCSVCLDNLKDPTSTKCGHLFCEGCIMTSIHVQKQCPNCRTALTDKDIHPLFF